ncbi:MAG: lamin tail domain-containing protein, partial [Candidatus Bipolaricaulia bacterium]
ALVKTGAFRNDGDADGVPDDGETVGYTFTVTNAGDVALSNVTVSDPKVIVVGGPLASLAPGDSDSTTFTATYTLTQADIDAGLVYNLATATGTPLVGSDVQDTDDETVTLNQHPAIDIVKTASSGPFVVDSTITYTYTVTNSGNVTLTALTVVDDRLGSVTLAATTLAPNGSTSGTATHIVTQADVDAGSIYNTALATGTPPSGLAVQDTDDETVTLEQRPGLAIEKTGTAVPVRVGEMVNYEIVVTNTGNITLHGVTVVDAKLGLNQSIGTLSVGTSATIYATYGPVTSSDLPGPLVNTATADSDETDPTSDDHTVELLALIDLSLTQEVSAGVANVGDTVVLTINLSNAAGAADATGVVVSNTLGSGFQFVSANAPAGTSYDGATGTWTVGDLAAGSSRTLEISALVLATGGRDNPAEVSSAGEPDVDSIPANADVQHEDDDDDVVVIVPLADLAVQKDVDDATPGEGDTVVFTITVTNLGPSDATSAFLSDVLPIGLLYVADDGAGAYNTGTNRWTIGAVAVGDTRTLRITSAVASGTLGWTIVNVAEIVESTPFDPNDENNRDTAELEVVAADLAVDKSASRETVMEGEEFVYTVSVTNLGPNTATGVELTDILPLGITYVSDDGLGTYNRNSGVWVVGSLAVQASATLKITAMANEGTAGLTLTNVAEVTRSDQTDPDDSNNRDSADVEVIEAPTGGGGSADACTGKVVINEIAWAGTAADPTHEWVELRNVGSAPVDLTDWVLRWRTKNPVEPADYEWKTVALEGTLEAAGTSACALTSVDPGSNLRLVKRETDDYSWWVIALPQDDDGSYFLLERRSDRTVSNVDADVVYDSIQPYVMDLTDAGAVIELVDATGTVVDTANAFRSDDGRWPAGDAATFGTMERTDALGPDVAENWHTNLGILTNGIDANGVPLAATSAMGNSQALQLLSSVANVAPVTVPAGRSVEVSLDLSSRERREFGWPWITTTYRTQDAVAGGGGAVSESPSTYAFSTRTVGGTYRLTIDTAGLAAGEHFIWIVYGQGKAILVAVTIVP